MVYLDSVARRYGVRPSGLVGETDPLKALSIDQQAHNAGIKHEEYIRWKAHNRGRN